MSESRVLSFDLEAKHIEEKKVDIPIVDNTDLRAELISRIENLTLNIIEQVCSGRLPHASYSVPYDYVSKESLIHETDNTSFENSMPENENMYNEDDRNISKTVTFDFARRSGKRKFSLMLTVMATAHRLLITNTTITRRSFYYDLKSEKYASSAFDQGYIDQMVNHVAQLLNCAPWELNLVATSKGLVAGELVLSLVDNRVIDCTVPGGALIPQAVSSVNVVRATAKFVLIVEKDAVFQELLENNCTTFLNCILVTGKGYPDVATRMLVKMLSDKVELPVYIIVDADPFGVDVMCVYRIRVITLDRRNLHPFCASSHMATNRLEAWTSQPLAMVPEVSRDAQNEVTFILNRYFGSATLSKENETLACPKIRWLGIHPSELIGLGVKTVPLTKRDLSRLVAIEDRPYITEAFLKELRIMRRGKAEIEGVSSFAKNFLTATYLSCKIKGDDYI